MVMHSYPYLLFLLLTLRSRYALKGVSATCYTPSRQDRNLLPSEGPNVYLPCNEGDEVSMCCARNRPPSPPKPNDFCRRDGLCLYPDVKAPILWRESCTDQSWQSPSCTRICLSGLTDQGVPYSDIDVMVTECSDKSICCGHENKTCCANGQGVWIKDGDATTVNPFAANSSYSTIKTAIIRSIHPTSNSLSPTSSTATPIETTIIPSIHPTSNSLSPTSSTATPIPLQLTSTSSTATSISLQLNSTSSSQSKHDQSLGKIVGASIGGNFGIIILIAVLIWYFRSRRPLLSQKQESVTPHEEPRGITQAQNYEVSGLEGRHELGGLSHHGVSEIEGRNGLAV